MTPAGSDIGVQYHHQEHLIVFSDPSMTPAGNDIGKHYQKL
jgi:hypothetical protein